MLKDFYKNKTVLIIGASSGIGKAIALKLASFGTSLIITSENIDELQNVESECKSLGSECYAHKIDNSNEEEVRQEILNISSKYKDINILILNSGISQRATANSTVYEVHKRILQINFHSYVMITTALLPILLQKKESYIAVTSSISGKFGFHLRSSYAASKHALHGYFESLRLENINNNLYVTIICPGRVKTDISFNALEADGNKHNKMDSGQYYGISAEECAVKYLKAIKNKKKEKLIGKMELLMVFFKQYCSPLFYFLAKKIKQS